MAIKIVSGFLIFAAAALLASFAFTQWKARQIEARYPARGAFADVEGGRIHYRVTPPKGEPATTVALIHGASGNEADLRVPLGERLAAQGFRVVSLDRPGHGWSTRGEGPSDPAMQARQVRQALETIGVKRAVVVGHSLAGAMTLQLALDHKDIVEGVVLLAPVTHPWPGGVAAYYSVAATPVVGSFFANTLVVPFAMLTMDSALDSVFAPQRPPPGYRGDTGVELVLRPQTFRANAIDVAEMYAFVAREQARYKDISIPVEIVTGDSDSIVLTHIHSFGSARDIPGSNLQVMPGIGHSPHWSRPDEVAARIAAFARKARNEAMAGR